MIWTGAAAGFVHDHHHLINDGGESNRNGFLEVTDTVKTPSEIGGPPGSCFSRFARFNGQYSFLCWRMWYVINHGFSIHCAEPYLSPIPILRCTRVQGNAFFSNFQASQPFWPAACEFSANPMADAILQGAQKAYAFGGIPEDCGQGYGCKSEYWGKWCR